MNLRRSICLAALIIFSTRSAASAQLQDMTSEYREANRQNHVKHMKEVSYAYSNGNRSTQSTIVAESDWDALHEVEKYSIYENGKLRTYYETYWTDSTRTIVFHPNATDSIKTFVKCTRNAQHRTIKEEFYSPEGELQSTDLFQLDSLGRLLKRIELSSSGDSSVAKEIYYHQDTAFVALIAGDVHIRSLEVQDKDGNALVKASLDDQGNIKSQFRSSFSNGLFKAATSIDEHGQPAKFYELRYTFY